MIRKTSNANYGPEGFLATSRWLRDAFSNLRFELQENLAEGDTVITVATMTGQHTGVFNGIEPTGKQISHKRCTYSPSTTVRSLSTVPFGTTWACCFNSAGDPEDGSRPAARGWPPRRRLPARTASCRRKRGGEPRRTADRRPPG